MRRRLLIGGLILAACAAAGGAYAASSDRSPKQAFLNDVAKRLHVSPQQLKSAFQGALQDQLNAAVKTGKLTQAQANAIEKSLREGGPPPLPFFHRGLLPGRPFGPGLLPGRPFGPGLLPGGPFFGGGMLGAATQYTGITPVELFNQLASGKSLAQVATAHGKSVSGLESAMVGAERARLDSARKSGLISSSQEQQFLSRLQSKISTLVDRAGFRPRFGPLEGPPPGPRWRLAPRLSPVPFVPPVA